MIPIEKIVHVARALARAQCFANAVDGLGYEAILKKHRDALERQALAAIHAADEFDRGDAVQPPRPPAPDFELEP